MRFFNSNVDTIFECGGQDAKFTVFNPDGTVKKAKMNLSCMAGTGQSMKNMIDMLGLDFRSFRNYAMAAERTPLTDEMCAIFTEADILKLVALGFPLDEVSAATAYGFMGAMLTNLSGTKNSVIWHLPREGLLRERSVLQLLPSIPEQKFMPFHTGSFSARWGQLW